LASENSMLQTYCMRPGNQEKNSGYKTTQLVHDDLLWVKDHSVSLCYLIYKYTMFLSIKINI
jgi:heme-binding NEAT domain protein